MGDKGFYLGRIFDLKTGKTTTDALLYDPDDLTTHAVVVGMTGSGKTGLCIDLLEEAALNGHPGLDDRSQRRYHQCPAAFPGPGPADFQPWVNPDQARREGKTVEQAGAEAAESWKKGLAEWGITPERLQALQERGSVCRLYSRLGCGHPGQHPGLLEGSANPLGRQPGAVAREDLRHGHRSARAGGLGGYRSGALTRAYPALQYF